MSSKKLYTLVFPRKGTQILLGMKKYGFGKGKWNGFGGKVEPEETIKQAAIRETNEESGIIVQENNLNFVGNLEIHFQSGAQTQIMVIKVYNTSVFEGNPTETNEMKPKWFNVATIPFKDMWPDNKHWFPHLLKGNTFTGTFWFQGLDNIIRQEVRQISKEELEDLED